MLLPRSPAVVRAACAAWAVCVWGLGLAHAQFDARSPEALRSLGARMFDQAVAAPVQGAFKFQRHPAPFPKNVSSHSTEKMPAPAVKVPLDPLLNGMYKSKAVFMAGNVPVHLFGNRSQNEHTWFLGLYPEGEGKPTFFNSIKILRQRILLIPVLNRSSEFEIKGSKYTIYIQGELSNRMRSKAVIEPQPAGEPKTSFTATRIAQATFETGYPVKLGDTTYRLLYTQDFTEDEAGEFAGFSKDRSIAFMFACEEGFGVYHFYERDIPKDRILITTPKKQNPNDDDSQEGTLTLGLRINEAHELEIYFPVRPSVDSLAR